MKRWMIALLFVTAAIAAQPRRGWLGVAFVIHGDGKTQWLHVRGVAPGGPAERAGIAAGDLITAIDGKTFRFRDDLDLLEFLGRIKSAQRVVFTIIQRQKTVTRTVVAADAPAADDVRWRESLETARRRREQQKSP